MDGNFGGGLLCPQDVDFERVWSRRYVFDNEIAFPEGVSYLPSAHYATTVRSFPAAICIRKKNGRECVRFNAPEDVEPPYTMRLSLCGRFRPSVFVTKDGVTKFSYAESFPADFNPIDKSHLNDLVVEGEGDLDDVFAFKPHAPFDIEQELYRRWCKKLKKLNADLWLSGHLHTCFFEKPGEAHDSYGYPCPVLCSSRTNYGKENVEKYTLGAVTISNYKDIKVEFVATEIKSE